MVRRDTTSIPSFDTAGAAAPAVPADLFDAASARRLRRVALRITRDPSAADDVVQCAFEKALRHGAGFRGEARPSTWLHRIVVNEALMWHRSEARRRAQLARPADFEVESAGAHALDELIARERSQQLQRALARLRPEDADLLARCALGEQSYGAWARERGLHATAAKARAFRARRALRAALEDEASRRDCARLRRAASPRVARARAQQQPPSSHGPRVSR
jgi:RNA polymerase sigma-70 factor (ECF subfamily)